MLKSLNLNNSIPKCIVDSLINKSEFVRVIEKRQGTKIGCIEEVAYRNGFIDKQKVAAIAGELTKSGYGEYLKRMINIGS